jgi:hypothetical protein
LGSYSFKVDQQTGRVLSLLEDKDNNAIDALRYALEALMRAARSKAPPSSASNNPPDLGRWRQVRPVNDWKTA